MDDAELVMRARSALAQTDPAAIAERIILFRRLLQSLEELLVLKHHTHEQRKCLRDAVDRFVRTMGQIREATSEWNLGLALTNDLVWNLTNMEECLDELSLVLLADRADDSAMMASNRPNEG